MKDINDHEILHYYDMKTIRDSEDLRLSSHPNFEDAEVNIEKSAIHVPINVYEVRNFSHFMIIKNSNR